jgi:N-acetylglucosamine-6-phosphate deacetylase
MDKERNVSDKVVAIRAGQVLTPFDSFSPGVVVVEGERIAGVGPVGEVRVPARARAIQAEDKVVAPGFIDSHIHGWGGTEFGESTEGTIAMCRLIVSAGTTGVLPTLGAEPEFEDILEHIRAVRRAIEQGTGGAQILGIHMEGPYFSTESIARGSQEVPHLRKPSVDELKRMVEESGGSIRKMSIAPELPGALEVIREMARWNIVPSAGHSTATYEQALEAVELGLRCATHAFNGMIPFHHRRPGLLGAVLTEDRINAEMIGDGEHISAVAMRILLRCKGVDRVHLVTDNTVWAGMPDGTYEDHLGRRIVKERTKAHIVGGTLAGSVAPMNYDVGNVARSTGAALADAVRMATWNPAQLIGVTDRKGSLEPGKDADLVIMDAEANIYLTMVRGREVYRNDAFTG